VSTERQAVNVQIFGSEYQVLTDSDPDHTRRVAQRVDRKMREIANTLSLRSVAQISVLTALNLADELLKAEAASQALDSAANTQADLLAESVEPTR
jgi:cell division protein ZapA